MTQTKPQISVNYAAEIIALGFSIRPYPESERRHNCDFLDQHCTSYSVHPFREFKITIGQYLEDAGRQCSDPTFSRFTIIYNSQDQRQITEASKLRRGLQEYGITFNETPHREQLVGELEKMLDALKK